MLNSIISHEEIKRVAAEFGISAKMVEAVDQFRKRAATEAISKFITYALSGELDSSRIEGYTVDLLGDTKLTLSYEYRGRHLVTVDARGPTNYYAKFGMENSTDLLNHLTELGVVVNSGDPLEIEYIW